MEFHISGKMAGHGWDVASAGSRPHGRWTWAILWIAILVMAVNGTVSAAETTTYVLTDAQGTVLAREDAQGTTLGEYDYRPYGMLQAGTALAAPGYTGHVMDPDAGLIYMQQRYYDPQCGCFLSIDPVTVYDSGDMHFFNRYAYASNNPINRMDPDGRCAEDACIVEGGVAIGAGVVYAGAAVLIAAGVCVEACGKVQSAIKSTAKSVYDYVVQESRSKPPAPLPEAGGRPHSIPDGKGGYTTYPSGKPTEGKQYRPDGKPHGDIPRPNVKEWKPNVAPDGTEYPGKGEVRPPESDEIPSRSPQTPSSPSRAEKEA